MGNPALIEGNKNLRVTVVVLNWNGEKFISDCLEALENQTFKEFETLVVDNGSIDRSVEQVKKSYPHVKMVCLGYNAGFCKGNNTALKRVKTPYVALLNNDAIASPDWLKQLVKAMEKYPEAGLAASKILFFDHPEIIDRVGDAYTVAGVGRLRGRGQPRTCFQKPEWIFGACAAAALYRTKMLEKIGLFDEDFFLIHEDVDLSFRAQLSGYKCVYVPDALVYHKVSASIGQESETSVYFGHRNLEWVYLKNMPPPLLFLTFPFHILYNVCALVYFACRGKTKTFIKAKLHALAGISAVLKKRKHIMGRKKVNCGYLLGLFELEWIFTRRLGRNRKIKQHD